MRRRVVVTSQADRDADECALCIACDSLEAALRLYDRLAECYESLAVFPFSGAPQVHRGSAFAGIHAKAVPGFPSHFVFYRVTEETVEVSYTPRRPRPGGAVRGDGRLTPSLGRAYTRGMDDLYVNLPEGEAQFVRERATEEGLSSPDEYVARLVREERKRRLNERLAELIQEGIESGLAEPLTPADWDHVRSEVSKRRAARSVR